MGFFLNGAEFLLNSVNSANSGNLINRCCLCLPGTVVASWFITQGIEGSNTAFFAKKYFSNSTDSVDYIEFI